MLEFEKKLKRKGLKKIVGLDEAGRGSLAGPVVAAAVAVRDFNRSKKIKIEFSKLIKVYSPKGENYKFKDSKKLTSKTRKEIRDFLVQSDFIEWGIGTVSEKIIDKVNILEATKKAMRKAMNQLISKTGETPDCLVIDGNFKINSGKRELSIIRGDENVFSCMAAGVIAKVFRDELMGKHNSRYPLYGFAKNKGYGTLFHRKAIQKNGHCAIHRKSFRTRK